MTTLRGAIEEYRDHLRFMAERYRQNRKDKCDGLLAGARDSDADALDSILASHSEDGMTRGRARVEIQQLLAAAAGVEPGTTIPIDLQEAAERLARRLFPEDVNEGQGTAWEAVKSLAAKEGVAIPHSEDVPMRDAVIRSLRSLARETDSLDKRAAYLRSADIVENALIPPEDVEGVPDQALPVKPVGASQIGAGAPSALPVELEHVHRIGGQGFRHDCPLCLSVQELLRLLLRFYKANNGEDYDAHELLEAHSAVERKLRGED